MGTRTISVRLTDEQLTALQAQSELTLATPSRIVQKAVELYLALEHPVIMAHARIATRKQRTVKHKDTVSYPN